MNDFDDLDDKIRLGWGNISQSKIPPDWRTRKPPNSKPDPDEIEDARQRAKRQRAKERRAEAKALRIAAMAERPRLVRRGKWGEPPEIGKGVGQ